MTDTELLDSTDVMKWAEEFCRIARDQGVDLGDDAEGWLVGWFASAMAAQDRETRRRVAADIDPGMAFLADLHTEAAS